jgi:hypothetical protein
MRRVEYRIERIPLSGAGPRRLQLVERLAQLGRHGWHVASADLTPNPDHSQEPVTVLLERELDETIPPDTPPDRAQEGPRIDRPSKRGRRTGSTGDRT